MSEANDKVIVDISKNDTLDDLDRISKNIKIALVDKLTDGGKVIPGDKEGVEVLLKVVGTIDSQTNNRRKNEIEERQVNAATQAAANVADIIKTFGGSPFSGRAPVTVDHQPDLPEPKLVPNIDYIGTEKLEYETFVNETSD